MKRAADGQLVMHYTLDEHGEPVPCLDIHAFVEWWATAERRVAHDMDENDETGLNIRVSTVFTGNDRNFLGDGPPVLWESMIFGGLLDGERRHYSSREAALLGHQRLCQLVSETLTRKDDEPTEGIRAGTQDGGSGSDA